MRHAMLRLFPAITIRNEAVHQQNKKGTFQKGICTLIQLISQCTRASQVNEEYRLNVSAIYFQSP